MASKPTADMNNSMDLFDDSDEQVELSQTEEGESSGSDTVVPVSNQLNRGLVDIPSLECPFCSLKHSDQISLQNHIDSRHTEFDDSVIIVESESSNTDTTPQPSRVNFILDEDEGGRRVSDFVCPYCEASLDSKKYLANHLIEVHEDMDRKDLEEMIRSLDFILCPFCLFIRSSSTDMQNHVMALHSDNGFNQEDTGFNQEVLNSGLSLVSRFNFHDCPICGLVFLDTEKLQEHVELHFNEPTSYSSASSSASRNAIGEKSVPPVASSSTAVSKEEGRSLRQYQKQYKQNLEKAVVAGLVTPAEYHEYISKFKEKYPAGEDEGNSKVEGIIELLHRFYERNKRKDQQAYLCFPTDYYCGSYGDKGWGCGYRNFQMLLTCLERIPLYSRKLFSGSQVHTIPSVPKIQEMIEAAWQQGFDKEGCLQLGANVVNTTKWIGATEVVATLSSLGIKCKLVDFPCCSARDGTHPRLFQWVRDYFQDTASVKPPLYLQHQGHSRTIIGVERDKAVSRLLLFDPGSSIEHIAALKYSLQNWKQLSAFRRNVVAFKAKQYQIVAVNGLLNDQEYERAKRLTSTVVL